MTSRILVIDDSLATLEVARQALSTVGYEVETSTQAVQMANELALVRPDLVLLDVELPELKGTDAFARLRDNAGELSAWVALFSSRPEEELAELARSVGAQGHIRKGSPLDPSRLVREVRGLLVARREAQVSRTAMVVDDSNAMRHMLRLILEDVGYEVTPAPEGRTALELLQERGAPPDLMLVDLNMPELDGYGLVEAVRERFPGPPTIVMVTSESDRERILRALEAGANEYVMKPFTRLSLLEKLELLGLPTGG